MRAGKIKVTDDGNDQPISPKVTRIVLDQVGMLDLGKRCFAADAGAAVRVVAEQETIRVVRQQVVRVRVFRRPDQANAALPLFDELCRAKRGPQQHIGNELDHELSVTRQELGRNRDGLDVRAYRQAAANTGSGGGELGGVAVAGAFLHDRREQLCQAGFSRPGR